MEWNVKSDANAMQLKQKGEVPYFVFPNLEKTHLVRHGFSTRFGGVSKGHLSEMNLSYTRGDNPEYVTENFCRMADAIGFLPESLVLSQQTHTTNIRLVTKEDKGKGFTKPLDYENIDGLITNVPGLTLATFYADCVPLFFVDPVSRSIGLSHAGWRGTLKRMGAKTVAQMVREFHTEPEHLRVAIGPSICQDCYEVSEEVAAEFKKEFARYADERLVYRTKEGKYHLNLWRANEIALLEAGVRQKYLSVTNVCTCCNPDKLFSHRASHGMRGNLAAFLQLL
ncbi:MAG: peptidoglycan editing factor PgeF [Lachnospiraceae bacterium]|jgi:YfiH family protein|nr:peptidoglycan editing factor PgeF [Lachnospiraceae bacterium]MDE7059630.1 peptidoglycan editing factor PgeF [Lachnospiraceae bacterium]